MYPEYPQCPEYSELLDASRNALSDGGLNCDTGLFFGRIWYRFVPPAGTQMSEQPIPAKHCGTEMTGWVNGTHPLNIGQIVKRNICFVNFWNKDTCFRSVPVEIQSCGTFYLYKLQNPPNCVSRYCGV